VAENRFLQRHLLEYESAGGRKFQPCLRSFRKRFLFKKGLFEPACAIGTLANPFPLCAKALTENSRLARIGDLPLWLSFLERLLPSSATPAFRKNMH